MQYRLESGLDRLDDTLFALMILSRVEDRRRRRRQSAAKTRVTALMAPPLTRSSTRTIRHPSDQGRTATTHKGLDSRTAGCWGYTPLVHSLGPHFLAGRTLVNQDQVKLDVRYAGASAVRQRKAVLQPGMVFAFEPNACIGNHRVNIGGTVIVTATGCEELNHIPTTVTHKQ
jgi:hypothetical protein